MRKLRCLLPLLLVSGAICLFVAYPVKSSAVTLEILSSDRSLYVAAYAACCKFVEDEHWASASAQGTKPFSETVSALANIGSASGTATASQTSSLSPSTFDAEGTGLTDAETCLCPGFIVLCEANSTFDVIFRLSGACGYSLFGSIAAASQGFPSFNVATSTLTFEGPGGEIFSHEVTDQDLPFQLSGVLQAGDYSLTISTICYAAVPDGGTLVVSQAGSYELHFSLDPATVAANGAREDLLLASPNPFTSSSRIHVPENARGIRIYDTAGRVVRKFDGSAVHEWDGRDEQGEVVPAGMYFVRVADERAATGLKLVRIR
jgi:hypothetical protein